MSAYRRRVLTVKSGGAGTLFGFTDGTIYNGSYLYDSMNYSGNMGAALNLWRAPLTDAFNWVRGSTYRVRCEYFADYTDFAEGDTLFSGFRNGVFTPLQGAEISSTGLWNSLDFTFTYDGSYLYLRPTRAVTARRNMTLQIRNFRITEV